MMWWDARPVEGTTLEVRPLSARQMAEIQGALSEGAEVDVMIRLAAMSAFEKGADSPKWTIEEAQAQPWRLIQHISNVALELNGMAGDPVETATGN